MNKRIKKIIKVSHVLINVLLIVIATLAVLIYIFRFPYITILRLSIISLILAKYINMKPYKIYNIYKKMLYIADRVIEKHCDEDNNKL